VLVEVTPPANASVIGPDRDVQLANHGLVRGAYKLRWQVLAADGHITRGEISFEVKQ